MNDQDAMLSISSSEGIRINVCEGDRVVTNATTTVMCGIQQLAQDGGKIEHMATDLLHQERNEMSAIRGGKITNQVVSGMLSQSGNKMDTSDGGEIHNLVGQVRGGDFESLRAILISQGVLEVDIVDLKNAITVDRREVHGETGQAVGPEAAVWVGKMVGKAVSGVWNISAQVAAGLLTEVIKKYLGL